MLQFNTKKLTNDIIKSINNELKNGYNQWKSDLEKYMGNTYFKKNARTNYELYETYEKGIKAIGMYLTANNFVLADAFGTGSLMLDEGLAMAKSEKEHWNPERTGKTIVGRKSGEYTDILGNKRKTSGTKKGESVEGIKFHTRGKAEWEIKPVRPSKAIQIANQFLFTTFLNSVFQSVVKNTNFSDYLIESYRR